MIAYCWAELLRPSYWTPFSTLPKSRLILNCCNLRLPFPDIRVGLLWYHSYPFQLWLTVPVECIVWPPVTASYRVWDILQIITQIKTVNGRLMGQETLQSPYGWSTSSYRNSSKSSTINIFDLTRMREVVTANSPLGAASWCLTRSKSRSIPVLPFRLSERISTLLGYVDCFLATCVSLWKI